MSDQYIAQLEAALKAIPGAWEAFESINPLWLHIDPAGYDDSDLSGWADPAGSKDGQPYDINQGLDISTAIEDGCVRIQNQHQIAQAWVADAQHWADTYAINRAPVSARCLYFAGTLMAQYWYMFPYFEWKGKTFLAPMPAVSDADVALSKELFEEYHYKGMQSGLQDHGKVTDSNHLCFTVANNPQKIVLGVMQLYNTDQFKHDIYRHCKSMAQSMDGGAPPVNGYTHPREWGYEDANKYRKEFEGSWKVSFPPGREELE